MTDKPQNATHRDKGIDCGTTNSDQGSSCNNNGNTTPFIQWPWWAQFTLVLSIIVLVGVLLVGLPTISMFVVEKTSVGLSEGTLAGTVSFWGTLFAAFISLVVTFIAGVFAFTAFKVEGNAAQEARKTARQEARYTAKREIRDTLIQSAKDYIAERDPDGDEKSGLTRGERAARMAADDYIREATGGDKPARGEKLTRQVADDYIREATGEDKQHRGVTIVRKAADAYIQQADSEGESPRGDTIIWQAANTYTEDKGLEITRAAADGYVRSVVDDYAGEVIEGEDRTRVETMTRELVDTIGANEVARLVNERLRSDVARLVDEKLDLEVARLVDEKLASLSLMNRLRIGSGRRGRRDETDSTGNDQG